MSGNRKSDTDQEWADWLERHYPVIMFFFLFGTLSIFVGGWLLWAVLT